MSILEFSKPIPVTTELGEGYILYVTNYGMYENDEFTIVLKDGQIRHFLSTQIKVLINNTYNIK